MNFIGGASGVVAACCFWFGLHRNLARSERSLPTSPDSDRNADAPRLRGPVVQRGVQQTVRILRAIGRTLDNNNVLIRIVGTRSTDSKANDDGVRHLWIGLVAVGALVTAVAGKSLVSVSVAFLGVVFLKTTTKRDAQRVEHRQERLAVAVVSLARVGVCGGLSARAALHEAVMRTEGLLDPSQHHVLVELDRRLKLVRPLRECVPQLERLLGDTAARLIDLIERSDATGASLNDSLASLVAELGDAQVRRAEKAARQVPVKLLFPLVACILPAFAVIALVPLLLSTLQSLRFS